MLTRVITLRFNGLLDAFDDGPLRDFILISVHSASNIFAIVCFCIFDVPS